jgi:hypothetical protein
VKMKVMAVTRETRDGRHIPEYWYNDRGFVAAVRVVHLECGHEFQIPMDAPSPSQFDCRYCSHVPTIEEQREARIAHQAEAERQLR